MYVSVCLSIYLYSCIYGVYIYMIYTYTYILHIYTHIYTYIHIYIHIYIYTYIVYIYTYIVYIYTFIHLYIHDNIHIHIYVYMYCLYTYPHNIPISTGSYPGTPTVPRSATSSAHSHWCSASTDAFHLTEGSFRVSRRDVKIFGQIPIKNKG